MKKQNPATIYLSKWPESSDTHKTMLGALNRVAQLLTGDDAATAERFAWHELRYSDARAIPAKLRGAGLAPRSINKMLSAVRGVLETAWRAGMLPGDEYQRIEIKNERGRGTVAGRALSPGEVDAIAVALDDLEPQEAAALAVMCACGLRRVEVVTLRKEDYNRDSGRLVAHGKGNKDRVVPVAPRWRPWIEKWWATLPGPRDLAFDMTRRQVSTIVDRFWQERDLEPFTPHDLRRTFITRVIENSDIAIAQRLAGHSDMNTTGIYDRRSDEAENKAVEKL